MSMSGPGFQPEPLRPAADVPIQTGSHRSSPAGPVDLSPSAQASKSTRSRWPILASLVAVAAAVAIGFSAFIPAASDEKDSSNWKHVEAAQQSAAGGNPVQWRVPGGAAVPSAGILVSQQDRDLEKTQLVREALLAGNMKLADQLVFGAAPRLSSASVASASPGQGPVAQPEVIPEVTPAANPEVQAPEATLSAGMRAEIEKGDVEFYHIYLYDSCYEDGDVVEILIDGQPMFLTPIGNQGSTVSVPISKQRTTVISVRGIFDGGGGITVGCRTSQGDGFVRSMAPGEIQPLSVVFPN